MDKYPKGVYARNKRTGEMFVFHKGMLNFHDFSLNFDIVEVDSKGEIVSINNKKIATKPVEEDTPVDLTKEESEAKLAEELLGTFVSTKRKK